MATGSEGARLRVLISDLPDLQADVVATLVAAEPDMVVVGERESDPMACLDHLSPDVILVSPSLGSDDGRTLARLRSSADVGVLAIDASHGEILRVVVVPNDQAWPEKVIAAIRSAAPDRLPRHRRQLP